MQDNFNLHDASTSSLTNIQEYEVRVSQTWAKHCRQVHDACSCDWLIGWSLLQPSHTLQEHPAIHPNANSGALSIAL